MSTSNNLDELEQIILTDIQNTYNGNEIQAIIRIYRSTKSNRDKYFSPAQILSSTVRKYRRVVRRLRAEGLIGLRKGKEIYYISRYGINTGRTILEFRELGLI